MKKFQFTIAIVTIIRIGNAQVDSIDYLGQTPPGSTPVIFAPGIVSIEGRYEYGLSVSPDGKEIYYTTDQPGDGLTVTKYDGEKWTVPEIANLRGKHSWEFEAFFKQDGKTLFFTSDTNNVSKFWYMEKNANDWSKARYLDSPINSSPVMWCTFTSDETMYYGNNNNRQIYRSRPVDGKYTETENIGFNGSHPSVAPDESFFLFNSNQYGGYGKNDILIVFKNKDGGWTKPMNMNNKINSSYHETCASLSPDGKYIFFSRYNESGEKSNIYWVSSAIIDSLKETVTLINLNEKLPEEINLNQNYPNPFNPSTTIPYSLNKPSPVKLIIYNVLGQVVWTFNANFQNSGTYSQRWNALDNQNKPVISGIYFCHLEIGEIMQPIKMILIR
jgi:Tol biopolymer transport system component